MECKVDDHSLIRAPVLLPLQVNANHGVQGHCKLRHGSQGDVSPTQELGDELAPDAKKPRQLCVRDLSLLHQRMQLPRKIADRDIRPIFTRRLSLAG